MVSEQYFMWAQILHIEDHSVKVDPSLMTITSSCLSVSVPLSATQM